MLSEIQSLIATAADHVGPSVVGIGRRGRAGSGVVIDENRVLTNAHNLHRETVSITFADGRTADGDVVGADFDADLAVVSVPTNGNPPIPRGSGIDAGIGATVVALANPGGRGLRVTVGYVSGTERSFRGPRGRVIRGSLEHTAPLLPGSSGGPVVDTEGRLLGVNTNRLGEGFYLAIPAGDALDSAIDQLLSGETSTRVRLGVGVAPSHVAERLRSSVGLEPVDGVLVRSVASDSPAAAAGIREGDMLTAIGDTPIATADDLHDAMAGVTVGTSLTITLIRVNDEIRTELTF